MTAFRGTYAQKKGLSYRNQGNHLIHSRRGKNVERLSRASECTARAETSTNVSGRGSCVQVLRTVLPKSARTKRKVGKSPKNRQTYVYIHVRYYLQHRSNVTKMTRCERIESIICKRRFFIGGGVVRPSKDRLLSRFNVGDNGCGGENPRPR